MFGAKSAAQIEAERLEEEQKPLIEAFIKANKIDVDFDTKMREVISEPNPLEKQNLLQPYVAKLKATTIALDNEKIAIDLPPKKRTYC